MSATNQTLSQKLSKVLKIQDLRMVIALSQEKTILRAAEVMQLSQPAITKRLQDLEKELGVTLFQRMSRGVEPTSYGDVLITHAHIIINQIRHAENDVSDLTGGDGGRIIVGIPTEAASKFISKVVKKLLAKRKNAQVTLVSDYNIKLIPALKRGDIDLIVGRLPMSEHEEVETIKLYNEALIIFAHKSHPLATAKDIKLSELRKCRWIMPPEGSVMLLQVEQLFKKQNLMPPTGHVYSMSKSYTLDIIYDLGYVSVAPQEAIQDALNQGEFVQLSPKDCETHASIGIMTRHNGFLSPAALTFISICEQEAKAHR